MGGPDSKISTVDVESGDNMATLPVSRAHTSSTDTAEKNNAANKEMELKNVCPKPLERYGQFLHKQIQQRPSDLFLYRIEFVSGFKAVETRQNSDFIDWFPIIVVFVFVSFISNQCICFCPN